MSFTVDEDQRYFGVLVRCGKVKQCGVLAKLKSFHPLIKKKKTITTIILTSDGMHLL